MLLQKTPSILRISHSTFRNMPKREHHKLRELYDIIVVPGLLLSSRSRSASDLGYALGHANRPAFVLGIGSETDASLAEFAPSVRPSVQSLLRQILVAGGDFAFRGDFSAEVAARAGFRSDAVFGCPSMYWLDDECDWQDPDDNPETAIAFHGQQTLGSSLAFLVRRRGVFIDQNPSLRLKELGPILFGMRQSALFSNRFATFANLWDWISFLKVSGTRFSFGTRLHGTIASLLAGVPAVVSHRRGVRTREVANTFAIPSTEFPATMSEAIGSWNPLPVVSAVRTLRPMFSAWLNARGVPMNPRKSSGAEDDLRALLFVATGHEQRH